MSGGVDVLKRDGTPIDFLETGGVPLNCVFVGSDLVITDFGWAPPRQWEAHTQNLYYAAVSNFNWDTILRYLDQFQKGMGHIDPAIAAKLIGIVA